MIAVLMMSRPLRIEYPDAWYHVMNLGRQAGVISDAQDYDLFAELLKEISGRWNIRIAANGLMPDHYHMLVHPPRQRQHCQQHDSGKPGLMEGPDEKKSHWTISFCDPISMHWDVVGWSCHRW
jgi:hypothetical protein